MSYKDFCRVVVPVPPVTTRFSKEEYSMRRIIHYGTKFGFVLHVTFHPSFRYRLGGGRNFFSEGDEFLEFSR